MRYYFTLTSSLSDTEYDNNRIRKVDVGGIITTIAGTGTYGYSGDGGPATSARINDPMGVAVDNVGNMYIDSFCLTDTIQSADSLFK